MIPNWPGLVTSLIIAFASSGLIVALLTLRPQRAKMGAEATSLLTCASATWVARVQESAEKALARTEHLEQESYELRRTIADQQRRLDLRDSQLRRLVRLVTAMGVDIPPDIFGPPTVDPTEPPALPGPTLSA